MNKNKEQIKNEEITEEEEMVELGTISLSAAFELITIVSDAILSSEDSELAAFEKDLRYEIDSTVSWINLTRFFGSDE